MILLGPWFPSTIPCSAAAKDLIRQVPILSCEPQRLHMVPSGQCLTLDYTQRISAQEFLEHPFLTSDASNQPRLRKIVNDINTFRKHAKFRKAVSVLGPGSAMQCNA